MDDRDARAAAFLGWFLIGFVQICYAIASAWQLFHVVTEVANKSPAIEQGEKGWLLSPYWLILPAVLIGYAVGHTCRMQTFKRGWQGSRIDKGHFVGGFFIMYGVLFVAASLVCRITLAANSDAAAYAGLAANLLILIAVALNFPRKQVPAAPDEVIGRPE